jgi:polar amino acid transport system substrate-binding protein
MLGTTENAIIDLDCREVTFAVENAYPPFNYIDVNTGEAAGWDYDVFNNICTLLHCTPVFVEAAWDGMIQSVADGQFDIAGDGITITDERDEIVDFSIGYISLQQLLLVTSDNDYISSTDDILNNSDYVVGTQIGTTNYETAIELFPEDQIKAFEQYPFAIQALISGDVDAVIIDNTAGIGYINENPDLLTFVGEPITSEELGFAFPEGSGFVEQVNSALETMISNGTLAELNAYYFDPSFIAPTE